MATSSDTILRGRPNILQDKRSRLGISGIFDVDPVVVCAQLQCDPENIERDILQTSFISAENIPGLEGTGYPFIGAGGFDDGNGY